MDYAKEFKEAIQANKGDKAADILLGWRDRNDANNKYAFIIYDGMPPSQLSYDELLDWLDEADKMEPRDASLKEWYRSTAVQIIQINASIKKG